VFGNTTNPHLTDIESFVTINGKYEFNQEKEIFENTDITIIPSIWWETFGLVVLESLANGVPIITTSLVGANDLIKQNFNGIIVKPDANILANKIKSIVKDREILEKMNLNICSNEFNYSLMKHSEIILNLYKKVCKGICEE
ncbi:MAG: glycosyltransferase, partial [Bacillus sp. (in: firmicutes)]